MYVLHDNDLYVFQHIKKKESVLFHCVPIIMQHGCSHVYQEMAILPEDHPLRQEAKDTKVSDKYYYRKMVAL